MTWDSSTREYWRKFYARELPKSDYEKLHKMNEQWILKTPYGPMVHKDTGMGYWETNVSMEKTNEIV
jgi:hypothetical protein